MSDWTYLWVNVAVIALPLLASFDKRVAFVKEWKAFWPACLLTMAGFIAWDVWFTHEGIWGFNQAHLVGIEVAGLPIEEWLFFVTVPYACVFTYACMKRYFPSSPLGLGHRSVTTAAIAICLAIAFQHLDKAYLGLTAGLCAVWLFIALVRWNTWMGHFWLTYVILLVPFVISNGVLTGIQFWEYPILHDSPESIADQIVWYNNTENSGWRLLAMPVDDLLYGLLLIGVNVSLFEAFSRRDPTAPKVNY